MMWLVKNFDVFMSTNKRTRNGKDKDDLSFGCKDGVHHVKRTQKFRQYYIMYLVLVLSFIASLNFSSAFLSQILRLLQLRINQISLE